MTLSTNNMNDLDWMEGKEARERRMEPFRKASNFDWFWDGTLLFIFAVIFALTVASVLHALVWNT